uniref:Uncharacterized protein n=1 Tax=Plectus sambesii TaxID=2011161 RepID=A0A914W091_9BILA
MTHAAGRGQSARASEGVPLGTRQVQQRRRLPSVGVKNSVAPPGTLIHPTHRRSAQNNVSSATCCSQPFWAALLPLVRLYDLLLLVRAVELCCCGQAPRHSD